MLEAKLVVVGGDAKSTEVKLKLPTVIGRGKEAGLTVPHALVSRKHTEIFERDGKLIVRDLGSLNGTFVNSSKIEGEQVLEPDQLLTLGNITFRAVYQVGSKQPDDPDTVTFEAASTVEEPHPGNVPSQPLSDIVSFSDKGSFRDMDLGDAPKTISGKPESKPKESISKELAAKSENAVKPDAKPVGNGLKTGELPDLESDIFNLEVDEQPGRSVSSSALGDLPAEDKGSFVDIGALDLGDETQPKKPNVTSIEIDLGDDKPAEKGIDSGRLDSFMKRLPQ